MRLEELTRGLPLTLASGSLQTVIRGICEDSRRVEVGDLFLARSGQQTSGSRYINDAIERGAVAVVSEDAHPQVGQGITHLVSSDTSMSIAAMGAIMCERHAGQPSHQLQLIGVTGTNGKTTLAHLIQQVLQAGGQRCGLIGTIQVDTTVSCTPATLTTPDAGSISRALRTMVDAGCQACVMEVSSHALMQDRVAGLRFAGGVFSNISGDHLDYHGSMDAYRDAKARLFRSLPPDAWAVINIDDPASAAMSDACRCPFLTTSMHSLATWSATVRDRSANGTQVEIDGPVRLRAEDGGPLMLRLIGDYNVNNVLQVAAVAWQLGLDGPTIARSLMDADAPPGRLQRVSAEGAPFTVLVDYAHSDEALRNALMALRQLVPEGGQLRVVFGCGGDRDRTKRPRMAEAAWLVADDVIITSDNPRTEDPAAIIDDAYDGVPRRFRRRTIRVTDRKLAIETIIRRCGPGDVVLIAGKGHEDYQIIGTTKHPFDDRLIAAETLRRLHEESQEAGPVHVTARPHSVTATTPASGGVPAS